MWFVIGVAVGIVIGIVGTLGYGVLTDGRPERE